MLFLITQTAEYKFHSKEHSNQLSTSRLSPARYRMSQVIIEHIAKGYWECNCHFLSWDIIYFQYETYVKMTHIYNMTHKVNIMTHIIIITIFLNWYSLSTRSIKLYLTQGKGGLFGFYYNFQPIIGSHLILSLCVSPKLVWPSWFGSLQILTTRCRPISDS